MKRNLDIFYRNGKAPLVLFLFFNFSLFTLFHAGNATECHFPLLHMFHHADHPHCSGNSDESGCLCTVKYLTEARERVVNQGLSEDLPLNSLADLSIFSDNSTLRTSYFRSSQVDYLIDITTELYCSKNPLRAPPVFI